MYLKNNCQQTQQNFYISIESLVGNAVSKVNTTQNQQQYFYEIRYELSRM